VTREQFVQAIKTEALDTAVRDTMLDLHDSPGRRPDASLTDVQRWYQALDPHSRELVEQVARMAADSATFGVMAILDGVRAIEAEDKGDLVLEYRKGATRLLLNDPCEELLHDSLASWFNARSSPHAIPVDIHHVPRSDVMLKIASGYDPRIGTCIALPTREHKNIPVERDKKDRTPSEQLRQDLNDLREYTQTPESVIRKLALEANV
jgi:hypothetical protein